MVGTVRKTRTFLPPFDKSAERKMAVYSSEFLYAPQITLLRYIPKTYKSVILMSTFIKTPDIDNEHVKKLPEMSKYYNRTMGGVDTLDQMTGQFTVQRRSQRWPMVVFTNMIDISGVNAYVLFTETHTDWNQNRLDRCRIFLQELGVDLVQDYIDNRKQVPRKPNAANTYKELRAESNKGKAKRVSLPTVKKPKVSGRCKTCPGKERKAYSACKCKAPLCGEHKIIVCKEC